MQLLLSFVFTAVLFASHVAVADQPEPGIDAARQPNLILILADDLGFETIGANGGTSYRTPSIDQLAANGARFTHCFVQPLIKVPKKSRCGSIVLNAVGAAEGALQRALTVNRAERI